MITTHECPCCGHDVDVDYSRNYTPTDLVTCPECKSTYRVETDADFVDGQWRDLTTLVPVETFVNGYKIVKTKTGVDIYLLGNPLPYAPNGELQTEWRGSYTYDTTKAIERIQAGGIK